MAGCVKFSRITREFHASVKKLFTGAWEWENIGNLCEGGKRFASGFNNLSVAPEERHLCSFESGISPAPPGRHLR